MSRRFGNLIFVPNTLRCVIFMPFFQLYRVKNGEITYFLEEKKLPALLPRVPGPTGTVRVATDADGVASYVFSENCAWDNIPFSADTEVIARETAAVCFGTLAQRDPRSRSTILRFLDSVPADAHRVFDVNLRQHFFSREIISDSLARCSILKINEDEAPVIADFFNTDFCFREVFFCYAFCRIPFAENRYSDAWTGGERCCVPGGRALLACCRFRDSRGRYGGRRGCVYCGFRRSATPGGNSRVGTPQCRLACRLCVFPCGSDAGEINKGIFRF